MTQTPPFVTPAGPAAHRIALPLRLQWLGSRMAGQPGAEALMERALDMHRRSDAVAQRVGQRGLPREQKAQLALELAALQLELEDLVAGALGEPDAAARSRRALEAMDPRMREHLASLLGVSMRPEHAPLLELKAAEYMDQGRAFDQVAAEFGFVEGMHLGTTERRGALILTHNGSLVQLSVPGVDGHAEARRYVYQNIYGGPTPTEGAMVLVDPVRLGHLLRSSRMSTSPVRRLRLAMRAERWEDSRNTFRHVTVTLMRARPARSSTMWGAPPSSVTGDASHGGDGYPPPLLGHTGHRVVEPERAHPVVRAASMRLERAAWSGEAARAELREHLERYADPAAPPGDAVLEAQIIGLLIHLQGTRTDAGEPGHALAGVSTFVTDRGERCLVHGGHVRLERPSRPALEIAGAGLGAQVVVRGAPLALLDRAGDIMVVLGDVVWVEAL